MSSNQTKKELKFHQQKCRGRRNRWTARRLLAATLHMMSGENMLCCLSLCLSKETTVPFNIMPSLGAVDCWDLYALLCKVPKYELLLGFKSNEVISTDRSHEKTATASLKRSRAEKCPSLESAWMWKNDKLLTPNHYQIQTQPSAH